ncbi:MAG: imelysin family protein [Rhodospirillales bacterium]|nr:imelysin family protein [Rhodospirillales bacterium]
MTRFSTLILACALFAASPARSEIDYRPINVAITDEVIIPAFTQLDQTAAQQAALWAVACQAPSETTVSQLKTAFHEVSDAWANLFHWSIGPITLYLRRDRFYHWPERRNSIGKGLAALLAVNDEAKLAPERFKKASVAVQGLPALERLLFTETDVSQNPWACKIGQSITANLAAIASEVIVEWTDDIRGKLERGEAHMDYFSEPSDFVNRVFNELSTGYAMIKEQKILAVLGASAEKAKPLLLENRRSGRFMRNLNLNVKALFQAQAVLARSLPDSGIAAMADRQKKLLRLLDGLGSDDAAFTNPDHRDRVLAFTSALGEARDAMEKAYVSHLGLTIGFNSLDGD